MRGGGETNDSGIIEEQKIGGEKLTLVRRSEQPIVRGPAGKPTGTVRTTVKRVPK